MSDLQPFQPLEYSTLNGATQFEREETAEGVTFTKPVSVESDVMIIIAAIGVLLFFAAGCMVISLREEVGIY